MFYEAKNKVLTRTLADILCFMSPANAIQRLDETDNGNISSTGSWALLGQSKLRPCSLLVTSARAR